MGKPKPEDQLRALVEADGCRYIRREYKPIIKSDGTNGKGTVCTIYYICKCSVGDPNPVIKDATYANFINHGKRCGRDECVKKKTEETYKRKFNGKKHHMEDPVQVKKCQDTLEKRTGIRHPGQLPDHLEKSRATSRKNCGADHWLQTDQGMEALRAQNRERCGYDYTFQMEGYWDSTCDKRTATCRERYDYDNPMQNDDVFHRQQASSYRTKVDIIGGKPFLYQGYENLAIAHLVHDLGYDPFGILMSNEYRKLPNIPAFIYEIDGVKHRYTPDIYVMENEWFIEVKSMYTYDKGSNTIPYKLMSVINAGFKCDIWIVNEYSEVGKYQVK